VSSYRAAAASAVAVRCPSLVGHDTQAGEEFVRVAVICMSPVCLSVGRYRFINYRVGSGAEFRAAAEGLPVGSASVSVSRAGQSSERHPR